MSFPQSKLEQNIRDCLKESAEEGIRQGLEDANSGKLRPAREFFAEFESTHRLGTQHRNSPPKNNPQNLAG